MKNARNLHVVPPASGGNGSDDGRLRRLEEAIVRIDTILPTLATKADLMAVDVKLAEAKTDIIKWLVGTIVACTAIALTALTLLLNHT